MRVSEIQYVYQQYGQYFRSTVRILGMRAEYWKYYPYSRIAYFRNVHCSNAEFRNTVRTYGENTISSETRTVFSNTVRISEIRISEMCISYKRVFQKCVSREYVFQDHGMYIRNTVRISKEYNPYFRSTFCIPEVLSAFSELCASELCIPGLCISGIHIPVILSTYQKYLPVFFRNTVCMLEMRILEMRSVFQKYYLYFRKHCPHIRNTISS